MSRPQRAAPRGRSDEALRGLSPALLTDLYVSMRRIRRAEEMIVQLYPEQEIRCPTHLSIGQEAVAFARASPFPAPEALYADVE